MVKTKLTVKQQKFADAFIESGNATQAAIGAGYSKKTAQQIGAENLLKPVIKNYIDDQLKIISDSKVADQKEVLEYLTSVMRGEETESVSTAKGIFSDVEVGAKDRIKAAELLGRRYGTFTDNVNLTTTDITLHIGGDDDGD